MSEGIGWYTFNEGQEIVLRRTKGGYLASVYVGWRLKGPPWRHLRDRDKMRLTYRALALLKKDLPPGVGPILMEATGEEFPVKIRTEKELMEDFASYFHKEHPEIVESMRNRVRLNRYLELPRHRVSTEREADIALGDMSVKFLNLPREEWARELSSWKEVDPSFQEEN